MKIGILQAGYAPAELENEHGTYPGMFIDFLSGNGFTYEIFPVVDGVFPDSPYDADGWLITGSHNGAYEQHDWMVSLEDLIRKIYVNAIPMAGVCFGHQIMAQALGGTVEYYGGQWGLGNVEYTHHDGTTSKLLTMHQDQVVTKPPEAIITAHSEFCKIAALSYQNKAISMQPHPEFTPETMEALIKLFSGKSIPTDQAEAGLHGLKEKNDSNRFAKEFAAFFKQALTEKAA